MTVHLDLKSSSVCLPYLLWLSSIMNCKIFHHWGWSQCYPSFLFSHSLSLFSIRERGQETPLGPMFSNSFLGLRQRGGVRRWAFIMSRTPPYGKTGLNGSKTLPYDWKRGCNWRQALKLSQTYYLVVCFYDEHWGSRAFFFFFFSPVILFIYIFFIF